MRRRPVVTKEAIWAAADQVEAGGGYASLAAVREVLGRGSYTTIAAAMKQREQLPRTDIKNVTFPMPKVFSEQFGALGEEIWAAAAIHAYERWSQRVDELERVLKEAESKIASYESRPLAD